MSNTRIQSTIKETNIDSVSTKIKNKASIQIILVGLSTSLPKLNQVNYSLKILHLVRIRATSRLPHKAAASVTDLEGDHAPLQKSRFS